MNSLQGQRQSSTLEQVAWDDVLSSISIEEKDGSLLVPFGQKEDGEIIIEDLAAIPHIIISGYTGSGKTTFVQTLFLIAASKYSANHFKLAVFDSKYVDYQFMESMPHFLRPVSSAGNENESFWDWLYAEEKNRYRLFSEVSAQDITSFNSVSPKPLPHIFIIIDDINSFHFSSDTVSKIVNSVQIARRAGVHFYIIASHVSGKEMPRDIASSITARVAFRAITKAESKAALGIYGAEFLESPGEALYKGNNGSLLKLHTVYMQFDEATRTVNSLKQKPLASLSDLLEPAAQLFAARGGISHLPEEKMQSTNNTQMERDPLFEKAASVCRDTGMATAALLQSHLRIGFMRAIQLLQQLEEAHIISSSDGVNPRKVLSAQNDSQQEEPEEIVGSDIEEYLKESERLLNEADEDDLETSDDISSTDDMFESAVEEVLKAGQVSTSMLQRKLRLGYARAARIMDEMEQAGIIGPQEGSLPRQVRITRQQWIERTFTKPISETNTESENDPDEDIHLRPFPSTVVSGGAFRVFDDKVYLHKTIMTKYGKATTDPQISATAIGSIVFRKATIMSKGYFTFGTKKSSPISYPDELSRSLTNLSHDSLPEFLKIEISNKDNAVVAIFLKQLSEDLALPISYV